jgi:hypothetical protein
MKTDGVNPRQSEWIIISEGFIRGQMLILKRYQEGMPGSDQHPPLRARLPFPQNRAGVPNRAAFFRHAPCRVMRQPPAVYRRGLLLGPAPVGGAAPEGGGGMTSKEYLSQAWRVDRMIDVKLEEANGLRALATKVSAVLSDSPAKGTRNVHSMEDIIVKLVDLEAGINSDINSLLALKKDISAAIKAVSNADYRALLELRYLSFKPWAAIASTLNYGKKYIFRLHEAALGEIRIPNKEDTSNA